MSSRTGAGFPQIHRRRVKGAEDEATSSDRRGRSRRVMHDAKGADEPIDAEATAANGVRAAWNAFFPGLGEEQHKPVDAVPNGKAPH